MGNREEPLSEVKKMTDYKRTSYFTSFHTNQETYLDPKFNLNRSFTENAMVNNQLLMCVKVGMITVASAGFGLVMGLIMSSFEFNSTRVVNTDKSNIAQLKQHFHGYSRFMKRQALHFARFGLYISLIEIPLELVLGRVNAPAIFFSGGMAAVLQTRYVGMGSAFSQFMGSGCMIGGLGLFMHSGKD